MTHRSVGHFYWFVIMQIFLFFLLAGATASAQLPQLLSVRLAIESPDMRDGLHDVTVRWYDDQAVGTLQGIERATINIQYGETIVVLGNASPLPTNLLERGKAWISIQFEGADEPTYRYPVLPQAFSHTAGFALVAASLDPRATGLVTSINELAGAVEIVGTNGVIVARNGQQIVVGQVSTHERGSIAGDGRRWEFTIQPQDSTLLGCDLNCFVDSGQTAIPASCSYDPKTRSYIVRTAAILQSDEYLRWHICRR